MNLAEVHFSLINSLLFFNRNSSAMNTTQEINSELAFGTPADVEMKYEKMDKAMEAIFDVMLAESQLDTEYTRSRQRNRRVVDSASSRITRLSREKRVFDITLSWPSTGIL
jgi:hypothetical protein